MATVGERIKLARAARGISQRELAIECGYGDSQTRISSYENDRTEPTFRDLAKIGRVLGINSAYLAFGDANEIDEQSEIQSYMATEVELPMISLIKATTNIEETAKFPRKTLESAGVSPANAVLTHLSGSTMSPYIPEGALLAIDKSDRSLRDGKLYLIKHFEMLRVAYVYRIPGGYRLRFANEQDWPTENITGPDAEAVSIVGRVFHYSVTL
jgi:transcriptional regulator with XRE-family HTH domain